MNHQSGWIGTAGWIGTPAKKVLQISIFPNLKFVWTVYEQNCHIYEQFMNKTVHMIFFQVWKNWDLKNFFGGCSYDPSQYQFGSDVTSASFAFNWSRGRRATLTRAARRYASCVYTEQALILSDVTSKLLVTWIVVLFTSPRCSYSPRLMKYVYVKHVVFGVGSVAVLRLNWLNWTMQVLSECTSFYTQWYCNFRL